VSRARRPSLNDTLTFLALVAAWIVVQQVILPRLGVPT
jgi:hypothetical protein